MLRSPSELHRFTRYSRPELIRRFGVHFDPAVHNDGVVWIGASCVITTKLDTSGALQQFQYENRSLDESRFSWTSQNRMRHDNNAGRRLLQAVGRAGAIHLFARAHSHAPSYYLGPVKVLASEGDAPMGVTFALPSAVPDSLRSELEGQGSDPAEEG